LHGGIVAFMNQTKSPSKAELRLAKLTRKLLLLHGGVQAFSGGSRTHKKWRLMT